MASDVSQNLSFCKNFQLNSSFNLYNFYARMHTKFMFAIDKIFMYFQNFLIRM